MVDRRTEWERFLDEDLAAGVEYRAARKAAIARFHNRRVTDEQSGTETEGPRLPPKKDARR
jgi:hypothetical protein